MATYTWHRTANQSIHYNVGWWLLASIPSGHSIRRVRFGWGFAGNTPATTDLAEVVVNPMFAGVVTTIGNGTEIPPSPLATPGDVAPPTQRWLWWEIRQPVALSHDAYGDVVTWRDSGPQEVTDVQTQVLATGLPGGDTLNCWFSYAGTFGNWDPAGAVQIFYWASLLESAP
jgi:hypothetical protein